MKHIFNEVIYESVKEGLSLNQVRTALEAKLNQKLESEYDLKYVEDKYTELLTEEWLQEAPSHFSGHFDPNSEICIEPSLIPELIQALNVTTTLVDCYRLTDTCFYTHMLEQLGTTSKHLRDKEKQIVHKFKCSCQNNIELHAGYVVNELRFYNCFVEALKYARNLNTLFNELNLNSILEHDNDDSSCLKQFLRNIQTKHFEEKSLIDLKHVAKTILIQDNFIFLDDLIETLDEFMKPAVVSKASVDGRELLEVSGKHIVVSEVLPEIEKQLRLSKIEEVRFVKADAVHVDADLEASVWRGTNIVVFGETLIVSKDRYITWNVSGKDADSNFGTEITGYAEDGTGLPGADGSSGESGGNVLIIVTNVENGKNLRIISNGGRGSNGQNGGPGRDGKDGYNTSHKDFKESFPPVSSLWNSSKIACLETTKRSILSSLQSVENVYYGSTELGPISNDEFENMFDRRILHMYNTYFEVKTNMGCKIFFSFCYEGLFTCCQSFLLYKGALGDEGKHGGTGGSGGRGGFPGNINIQVTKNQPFEIIELAENGYEGEPGNYGKMGKPGKKGLDRAYLDHTMSRSCLKVISPPEYESPSNNKQLTIKYYPETASERVFCPHNQLYAEITEVKKEFKESRFGFGGRRYEGEKNTRRDVRVTRKKTISQESVMERYKENTSTFNIHNLINTLERALQEMTVSDVTLKTEQVTTEVKVSRHLKYLTHNVCLSESDTVEDGEVIPTYVSQSATQDIIDLVNKDPYNMCYWTFLVQMTMNLQQLKDLWETANVPSLLSSTELDTALQLVFCNKYQLAVLQQLEAIGSLNLNHSASPIEISKMKCLPIVSVDHFVISYGKQETFGTIEDFFCKDSVEKREEIIAICKGQVVPLRESIKILIREFGESCGRGSILNALYRESVYFKNCNDKMMKQTITPLRNLLLSATNYKNIYSMLVESIIEQDSHKFILFAEEIEKDKFIKKLYEMYLKEAQRVYEWDNHHLRGKIKKVRKLAENQIKIQMFEYIKEKGPLSVFCRELLAHYFDTNIQVYELNKNRQILLVSNHNPRAERVVHILLKGSAFVKLNVSHDFAKMIEHHGKQGMLYNKILAHTDSCATKQQLDDFISKNPFSLGCYEGTDKKTKIKVKITHILNEEDNLNLIINTFKTDKDKSLIASRLDKLKLEYIGNDNILHYMTLHFQCEGKHISATELCFVINYVLKFATDASWTMPLVSWIIASNPQTLWLRELTLLNLEMKFKRMLTPDQKERWREYMSDQNEKATLMLFIEKYSEGRNNIRMEYVDELLYLLSCIPKAHVGLDKLDLSEWKFYLKDKYWAYQVKATGDWTEEQLKLASFHLLALENSVGIEHCNKIVEVIRNHSYEIKTENDKICVLDTLKSLLSKEICISERLLQLLSENSVEEWLGLIKKECFDFYEKRSLSRLCELIRSSGNTSENALNKLNDVEHATQQSNAVMDILIHEVKEESQLIKWTSTLLQVLKEDKTTFLESLEFYRKQKPPSDDEVFKALLAKVLKPFVNMQIYEENEHIMNVNSENVLNKVAEKLSSTNVLLATIGTAVHLKLKIRLRNTQLLTILMFVNNCKSILGQVETGEGKSLIVVCVAIIKALFNKKVDILTSSHVLAKRDAQMYKDIYKLFELNVSHNCSESKEERKKTYSNCQVVYGELANFQKDYLLDRFYGENILGDRTFDTVIVDEVDSMLLDRGNNILYLSHDIPGLDKLEPVFLFIWTSLKMPGNIGDNGTVSGYEQLRQRIVYEIFGRITRESLRSLDVSLTEKDINNTWEYLVSEEIIDNNGNVLIQHIDENHRWSDRCAYKDHLTYLLKKNIERKKLFELPKYLRSFVEQHLEEWIMSAMRAMSMECGVDYVVDFDRLGVSCDRNPNIIILDNDTGTDLSSSQWDEGLHQFLQLKHGCKISLISLKAVYKSNVSYLKLYQTILGLTGTLGSQRERELLKEVYRVDYITLPTAKVKALTEEMCIVCSSTSQWANTVIESVLKISKNRSVLIICETINTVVYLKKCLDSVLTERKLLDQRAISTYTRDYEELDVAKDLKPRHIIISTNLAGRGTDIKLSRELVDAGGLHVCLTFLPNNSRIEEQAFGRVARNGEPGSAQLIFNNNRKDSAANIIDLKKERDLFELLRITGVKEYYESHTVLEEKLFEDFSEIYWALNKLKHSKDVKSILLQYCLEQWAFWLDKHSKNIATASCKHFFDSLLELHHEDFNIWSKQIKNPFQLVKLGLVYLNEKNSEHAFSLFNRVIKEEPSFSEAAYYYRVCAKAALNDIKVEDILGDLEFVEKVLKGRTQRTLISAELINFLKERDPKSILQIDAFKEQQVNTSRIYSLFLQSISNILGTELTSQSFVIPTEINEQTSFTFYNDLLVNKVIVPKVNADILVKELAFVVELGMSPKEMLSILNKYITDFDKKQLLKDLKKCLPSRECFWEELVSSGILINEEKLAFIDFNKLDSVHSLLPSIIEALGSDSKIDNTNSILMHQPEENIQWFVFNREQLKRKIGKVMFKFLKEKKIIFLNKHANVSDLWESVRISRFYSISKEDFDKVGISDAVATRIVNELVQKQVIKELPLKSESRYNLIISAEDIEKIELETCKTYTEDVKSLLTVCFAFRIALDKFSYLVKNQSGDCKYPCFQLPSRLHKQVLNELQGKGIIKMALVDPDIDGIEVLKKLYPPSMGVDCYIKLFSEFYGNAKTGTNIVKDLIAKEWLVESCSTTIKKQYHINADILEKPKALDDRLSNENATIILKKPKALDDRLSNENATIKLILSSHLNLTKGISEKNNIIKSILESSKNTHYRVEIPSFTLTPLLSVLQKLDLATTEAATFSLNGFDEFIGLEEKKWTGKMKRNLYYVTALAVVELTVGAALEVLSVGNPVGNILVAEGINDLIFVVSSIFSGYCTWEEFCFSKLMSLTLSIAMNPIVITSICSSTFGKQLRALFTVTTVARSETTKLEVIKSIAKRVIIRSSQGLIHGMIYATIDHVIQPQLEKLGETLIEVIYSDIDNTVDNHPFRILLEKLFHQYGDFKPDGISIMIVNMFISIIDEHKNMNEIDWSKIVTMVNCLMNSNISKLLQQTNADSNTIICMNVYTAISNIVELIEKSHTFYKQITTMVESVLDKLEGKLQEKLDPEKQCRKVCKDELERFCVMTLDSCKEIFKSELSSHINEKIIFPALCFLENSILRYCTQIMLNKCDSSLAYRDAGVWEMFSKSSWQTKGKNTTGLLQKSTANFVDTEYETCLLEMLKKKRSAQLFVNVLKKNTSVDLNFIEMCCYIIPKALTREGIVIPGLEIIVERDGVQQRFCTTDAELNVLSIIIVPEADLTTNLTKNRVLIKQLFDILFSGIVQRYPHLQDLGAEAVRLLIINVIERYTDIPNSWDNNQNNELKSKHRNQFSSVLKKITPYEHSYCDGTLLFSQFVELDLPEKQHFSCLEDDNDHILEGFETALENVNSHIYKIQTHLKPPFKLVLENLCKTKYEIAPRKNKESRTLFHCFVAQYYLVIPLKLEDVDQLVDFGIILTLTKQSRKARLDEDSPQGPHIVYEVNPINSVRHLPKGIKGHVLLNAGCVKDYNYTAADCHVAGELIVPTQFRFMDHKKYCKVLIIGDSMLRHIHQNISQPNCEVKLYPLKASDLKEKISVLAQSYKGIRCVVLYVGTVSVSSGDTGEQILSDILEVVEEIKLCIGSVTIFLCGLILRKYPAETKNTVIEYINVNLMKKCKDLNVIFIDTKFIEPDDLLKTGIYLNRRGYKKLGHCISKRINFCRYLK